MVHLSEILGLAVLDVTGSKVGRLYDLEVDSVRFAVERIHFRQKGDLHQVAWGAIEDFSTETRRIRLAEGAAILPAPENAFGEFLLLARDVLDRQIIDIRGRKVVRVNDILLEPSGEDLLLRRVEVGLTGAVRRLLAGVLTPRLVRQIAAGLSERGIPWDYVGLVEPGSTRIRLKVHQHLARMHPADLADILEDLGRVERRAVVTSLDTETAAQALSEVEPGVQASVVEAMHVDRAADLLEEMQPDEAADILGDLPEERSRALLEAMEDEDAEGVRELLHFKEDSAGGLMTTEFFRAREGWSIAQTLQAMREQDEGLLGEMDEIPVVGEGDRLVGVVPLTRLVRGNLEAPVVSVMRRESRAVSPTSPFSEVVERFEKYHLRALAVVDDFGELVGLISIEDVFSRLATGD